eukprot:2580556-Pyramimonas_sp.AAC.1
MAEEQAEREPLEGRRAWGGIWQSVVVSQNEDRSQRHSSEDPPHVQYEPKSTIHQPKYVGMPRPKRTGIDTK